jgi:hypothetical protein
VKTIFEIKFDGLDKTISEQIQKLLPNFDDPNYLFYVYEYHFTTYYAKGDYGDKNYIWKRIDKVSLYELLRNDIKTTY